MNARLRSGWLNSALSVNERLYTVLKGFDMRVIFGVLSLLVVLMVVGILVKKQLGATQQAIPALVVPGAASTANKPASTLPEQSQQIQQQYKQAVEGAMQQARPMLEEKP